MLLLLLFVKPTSTKPQAEILKLNNVLLLLLLRRCSLGSEFIGQSEYVSDLGVIIMTRVWASQNIARIITHLS